MKGEGVGEGVRERVGEGVRKGVREGVGERVYAGNLIQYEEEGVIRGGVGLILNA